MKKYFSLTLLWTLSALMCWCVANISATEADPIDEQSFSVNAAPQTHAYHLISVERISLILKDHLDLFPASQIPRLAQHIRALCMKYRFDPSFILGLIEVESRFHIKATSRKGAIGLMQVQPATAQFVIKKLGVESTGFEGFEKKVLTKLTLTPLHLTDPFLNTSIGIRYLDWLRNHYKHRSSPYFMVAAYNLGPTKMNQLLARQTFTPVLTKQYFLNVRRCALRFRFYPKC